MKKFGESGTKAIKTYSSRKYFWREIGGGGVQVISSKLKLIKYVSTEENDDILEVLDL
jgi:hypothetical protein